MWLPFERFANATPLMAKLFDSVPPLVKMMFFDFALMSFATCLRAFSMDFCVIKPKECELDGFPKFSNRKGKIAFATFGSIGVVAL